ncbi:MAG TPA: hypothetical protein VK155_17905, partial [Bacteroidales bacterium]|nr:hypothetical protein [Bacteroidales bacterium]
MAFSLKNKIFQKKFDISPNPEDSAFSNSIVIDPSDRSYYGLTFPIFSYNGHLQLIKGSLDSPGYRVLGSRIPFQFQDISSFSDLYFSRLYKKLIAVTIKNENGKSQIKVFTLSLPPDMQVESGFSHKNKWWLILLIGVIAISFAVLAVATFRRKKKTITWSEVEPKSLKYPAESPALNIDKARSNTCYLHFFGDFQVINSSGKDVTRKFTPLLKELFLLIWLNSIKNDTGISNEKIIQTLWPGFQESSAQNNKAVNIAKLRAILTENFSCTLTYKNTGYWRIDYKNRNVINDYFEFIKITSIKGELSKPDILKLVEFSKKGQFLGNLKYNWLEEYKVSVANEMISRFVKYLRVISLKEEPDQVIEIANAILNIDNLNEEAMENKCKGLITLGRHTVAKEVYDQFAREFRILYNAEYEKSFTSIAGQA